MDRPDSATLHRPRRATRADIPGMHAVRLAVRENRLTSTAIGEAQYVAEIERTGCGWVVEDAGTIVAFAVGNAETGTVWALFVHPDHEGRGHGRELQSVMLDWLFGTGLTRVRLSTEPGTRAQRFYESTGWRLAGTTERGELLYERHRA